MNTINIYSLFNDQRVIWVASPDRLRGPSWKLHPAKRLPAMFFSFRNPQKDRNVKPYISIVSVSYFSMFGGATKNTKWVKVSKI